MRCGIKEAGSISHGVQTPTEVDFALAALRSVSTLGGIATVSSNAFPQPESVACAEMARRSLGWLRGIRVSRVSSASAGMVDAALLARQADFGIAAEVHILTVTEVALSFATPTSMTDPLSVVARAGPSWSLENLIDHFPGFVTAKLLTLASTKLRSANKRDRQELRSRVAGAGACPGCVARPGRSDRSPDLFDITRSSLWTECVPPATTAAAR